MRGAGVAIALSVAPAPTVVTEDAAQASRQAGPSSDRSIAPSRPRSSGAVGAVADLLQSVAERCRWAAEAGGR